MSMAPTRVRRAADPSPDAQRKPRAETRETSLSVVPAPPSKFLRRLIIGLVALAIVATPFALVLVHVELTANELRLTTLQSKGDAAQTQYEKLRLQVAQLESPARIVADAQQLGMVTPTTIMYLTPTAVSLPPVPGQPGPSAGPANVPAPADGRGGIAGWADAKRVDAGR